MQESEQLAQLTRMRRIATGLLVFMVFLFITAKSLQSAHGYLSFVSAFAEAAMVGALADWFAVTALFRKPFGLPIPHTAIIPSNKDRIGESVANFLEHNFMTYEVLREELAQVDLAGTAATWLAQPQNSRAAAAQVVSGVPAFLRMIEDEDVGHFVQNAMAGSLRGIKFAPLLAEILSILVAGRQHHILFERVLQIVARALEQYRPYIRQKVHENSPRWMPKALDEKFFERLVAGLQNVLHEIQQEDSEWRDRFQEAVDELIDKLRTSPEYEQKLAAAIATGLGHPLFRSYAGQVWQDVKQRLLADTTSADSAAVAKLDDAVRMFCKALLQDTVVRTKLNQWLRAFATETIVERRGVIATLIKRVIRKWDADTMARKFELHVGKDLQYIRINGTLVGGMVGLMLHAVSFWW